MELENPKSQAMLDGFDQPVGDPTELMAPPTPFGGKDIKRWLEDLGLHIRKIFDEFDTSATRKAAISTAKKSREAYDQVAKETEFPWPGASNMTTPLTTIAVDEIEPRLVAAVVGRDPIIKAVPKPFGGASTEDGYRVTQYDNYVLKHKVDVDEMVSNAMHELLLDGTVFPLVSWQVLEKKKKNLGFRPEDNMPAYSQEGQQVSRVEKTIVKEGAKVDLVPLDFVWCPDDIDTEEEWENADVIRYIGKTSLSELKVRAQKEKGWVLDEWRDEELTAETSETTLKTVQQQSDKVKDYWSAYPPERRPIEMLEAYINYDVDGDGQQDELIITVTKQTFKVLRVRWQLDVVESNVKPLRRLRIFQRSGCTWGRPIYSIIKGMQNGMDRMWNTCINSADITMAPWGLVRRSMSGMRKNRLVIRPGVLHEVDDPDAVNFPNLSAFNPQGFIPLILQMMGFYEKSINVSDFMQGRESEVAGKRGSTATGTLAVLQEGKVKHEYRGRRSNNQFLDLFTLIHNMTAANMPPEDAEAMAILGTSITKFMMNHDYMFTLEGADLTSNKFIDRKETEDFQMLSQPYMQFANPIAYFSDLCRSYGREPKEYIDPELMQVVQQFMAVRQMVQMGLAPEMAQAAVAQGMTPEDVGKLMQQMGATNAKALTQQQEEKEGEGNGGGTAT